MVRWLKRMVAAFNRGAQLPVQPSQGPCYDIAAIRHKQEDNDLIIKLLGLEAEVRSARNQLNKGKDVG